MSISSNTFLITGLASSGDVAVIASIFCCTLITGTILGSCTAGSPVLTFSTTGGPSSSASATGFASRSNIFSPSIIGVPSPLVPLATGNLTLSVVILVSVVSGALSSTEPVPSAPIVKVSPLIPMPLLSFKPAS